MEHRLNGDRAEKRSGYETLSSLGAYDRAIVYYHLGILHETACDVKAAKRAYAQVDDPGPTLVQAAARNNLGVLEAHASNKKKAQEYFERAKEYACQSVDERHMHANKIIII